MATVTKATLSVGELRTSDRSTHAVGFGTEYAEADTPIGTIIVFATAADRVIVATHGYINTGTDDEYITVRGQQYLLHTGVTRTKDGDTDDRLHMRAESAPWTVYTDCGLSRRDNWNGATAGAWRVVVEWAAQAAETFAIAHPDHMRAAEVKRLTTAYTTAHKDYENAEAESRRLYAISLGAFQALEAYRNA